MAKDGRTTLYRFGKALEERKLTLVEVAERTGLHIVTLNALAHQVRDATPEEMRLICNAIGCYEENLIDKPICPRSPIGGVRRGKIMSIPEDNFAHNPEYGW